ncbi:MAG: UDP-N-acetylglucosamine--N-acetylmuramyl-(pentapeptide) pyrophosphoryl-undecaprenol N-acetylglucosamine transferase [Candidatus Pacebacteria bacterium]|nr:UDP-N-acetylglucosamine--N-acetylmuramyl-(pentapeptide) pyrophosphoryl-undecaprenol N-acetylglucosamine transferase [Candidatus Paceibacterota bacterium]
MKIVLTGGGSGGHFYPLIAVTEEIYAIVREHNLTQPDLYYLSNTPYDGEALFQNNIQYRHVEAGKIRTYFSFENATDFLKTLVGLPTALHLLFKIWPDIVFSKGGYASVPVVMAARILHIPVFIHDSDATPGRANIWAGKFAQRIGISYPDAATFFTHKDRIAYVGNPVRKEVRLKQTKDAHLQFGFTTDLPTILIIGGSQGAEHINNTILQAIPDLITRYQVIHQIGKDNYSAYKELVDVELEGNQYASRYQPYPYLDILALRTAAGAADLVISRAGSGSIFEIATWELPAILIPIPESVSRDQRNNAYAYARAGAAEVVEQHNCTPNVLTSEVDRILQHPDVMKGMVAGAKKFQKPDAAHAIAQEILRIALEHEL